MGDIGGEEGAQGEDESSGPLMSFIQDGEGKLFEALMSDVSN